MVSIIGDLAQGFFLVLTAIVVASFIITIACSSPASASASVHTIKTPEEAMMLDHMLDYRKFNAISRRERREG